MSESSTSVEEPFRCNIPDVVEVLVVDEYISMEKFR